MDDDHPSPEEEKPPEEELSSEEMARAYRNLASLEDSFRSLKQKLGHAEGGDVNPSEPEASTDREIPSLCRDTSEQDFVTRVDWSKIGLGVKRKLWLVMTCGVIAAAIGALGAFSMSKMKQATAVVLFTQQQSISDPQGVIASRFNVQTIAEMIQSPHHFEKVRQMLGIDIDVNRIASMVKVISSRTSNVIQITAASENPDLSIDVANALAQVSVDDSKRRYREHAMGAYEYYAKEEEGARKNLDEYSAAITRFKQQAKVFEMDLSNESASENASNLQKEYRDAAIEYEELLVEYENLQREIDKLPEHVVRYEYDDNPLKARIGHKEMSLLEARTKYGPENPKVQLLEEEIRQLRMALSDSSFDDSREQVYERNFIKEQLNIEQMRLQGRLRGAQKKRETLKLALSDLDDSYEEIPQEQLEYAALLRRSNLANEEVIKLTEVKRDAKSAMEREVSDLKIREEATEATRRSTFATRALPTLAFAFGSILGLFFVAISEITDGKITTPGQVRKNYRSPHLLSIPRLKNLETDSEEKLLFYIRTLSERLSQLVHDRPFGSVAFTSSSVGEGKSTIAFHLAKYYQRLGIRTAYVDFSYGPNPYINSESGMVLNTFLHGEATLADITIPGVVDCFKAGNEEDMKELLKSVKMRELWQQLNDEYDMVVVETPGLIEEQYAVNIAIRADLCLFVLGASQVEKSEIDSSLHELESSGVRPHGILLSRVNPSYIEDPIILAHVKKNGRSSGRSA